ncbi:MAG: primosomal protein N' [Phycisphaerales bacterium]|nr:primosomal protein N' [Phycisphaerales bacterium]
MADLFELPVTGWVEVAVDAAIDAGGGGLHYALDEETTDLSIGDAVTVPLGRGNRPTRGWIIDRLDQPPEALPTTIKHVHGRDADTPALPDDCITLACWIAEYYITPLGPTLAAMCPPRGSTTGGGRLQRWVQLAGAKPQSRLGATQQRIVQWLEGRPTEERAFERLDLCTRLGLPDAGAIDRLLQRGVLEEVPPPTVETTAASRPALTNNQQQVVDRVGACLGEGFGAHLLHGVTGSGKTEVYLQLVEQVMHRQQTALVLVPEILLTPQLEHRITSRFPDKRVALLHSGVSRSQRHAAFEAIEAGEIDCVLGARSAVLAPIRHDRLGLIIVDEEHDSSYRQDSTPRYHGRDVAVRRAQLARCPVLLGSATPSMESWWNATVQGRYELHRLPDRAPGLSRPKIRVVDRMAERASDTSPRSSMGPTLRQALGETLVAGRQTLLLLNRRGWATHVACRSRACGWVMRCDHCDGPLVFHRRKTLTSGGHLRCHRCHAQLRMPKSCPVCSGGLLRLGEGSQRLEDEIAALHPDLEAGAQLMRLDTDTRGSAANVQRVMDNLRTGATRVLVGTQMIAKGLDLPGVGLVGVIDADTSLHVPDFRAAERTFQLVAQVAGRCGRGAHAGQVIIQTCAADDPAVALAASESFEQFARDELSQRRAAGLPPARRMARCVVEHPDHDVVKQDATTLEAALQALGANWQVHPAGPCPIARIEGRHRWQVELQADDAAKVQAGLAKARAARLFQAKAQITVDVDPIQLM